MTDIYTKTKRSELMSRVRTKGTRPEAQVRGLVRELGYRCSFNLRSVPGRPDLVVAGRKTAVFVHGCFWHQHPGCPRSALPATRREWWRKKLEANVMRDAETRRRLRASGWRVTVVWECQLRAQARVRARLAKFFRLPDRSAKC